MGFEINDTVSIYNLKFSSGAYRGLEVKARGMTIREYNQMMRLALASLSSETDADRAKANMQSNDHVRECFFRRIISWNLTKNNEPVPVSEEQMDDLDSRLATVLIRIWLDELTSVPDELLGKSNSGETSPELSMTMELASANHQN